MSKVWLITGAGRGMGVDIAKAGVNALTFDPNIANILDAGLSGYDIATPGKSGHLFKTTNALSASPGTGQLGIRWNF